MTANIIELVDLTRKYGTFTAVDQLNLTIRKGEIFGLLGPNGAGKSTTILMMLGLTEPTSGSARVCGIDPVAEPILVKKKVGYLPEEMGFYANRSGFENLMYTARLNGLTGSECRSRVTSLLDRVGLTEAADKKTGKYSRGMLQRLGLADVLVKNPEVIILDEPTLGIDPTGVREFLDLIVGLSRADGITVLFSSHDLHHVQQVCDRVGLFVEGKLLAIGDIPTLSRQLFSGNTFLIEFRISPEGTGSGALDHPEDTLATVRKVLSGVEGFAGLNLADGIFSAACTLDASAGIAQALVQAGYGLMSLSKKEYGLNDIYYRYFEENDNAGKKKKR